MLRQHRTAAIQFDDQMAAFAGREFCALFGQIPLGLAAVPWRNISVAREQVNRNVVPGVI